MTQTDDNPVMDEGLSRRRFLRRSAAVGAGAMCAPALGWVPDGIAATAPPPAGFPPGIRLERRRFRNWARDILVDGVWTCVPRSPGDVVTVANWAANHGYRVRARGMRHTWAPLTVTAGEPANRVILVDTTQHLTSVHVTSSSPATVRAQAGATMDVVLAVLERAGHGFIATPAPGDLTIGGVLAIDGHGSAIPAAGEQRRPGHRYGSLSDLVLSLTAVVWDRTRRRFVLRTFERSHPHCKAFLTHLGRAFLTEVTLRVGSDLNLRCVSHIDIPAAELFASPRSGAPRSLASFLERTGRVEAIWYAHTEYPWLKVWSVEPTRPAGARHVTAPYNYPFSDSLPTPASDLADRLVTDAPDLAPEFGQALYAVTAAGLPGTLSQDIWGASRNLLLYVRPTTLRVTANGYAVLTARQDIQQVVSDFTSFYRRLLGAYRARRRYPVNVALEIRVSGLDTAPVLSAVRRRPDRPGWDVAVWFDVLTFPGTPDSNRFYRELETWAFARFSGTYAAVRPEWSKGWAYTTRSAWSDRAMLGRVVPALYRAGRRRGDDWDWAVATLDRYDPHRVFGNGFLDGLLR